MAAGGRMHQKIYPDPYGRDTWDKHNSARVFVHLCNSRLWREITGEAPPTTPVTAKAYARHGLPWYQLYDEGAGSVHGGRKLKRVKSVKQLDKEIMSASRPAHFASRIWQAAKSAVVRDGKW